MIASLTFTLTRVHFSRCLRTRDFDSLVFAFQQVLVGHCSQLLACLSISPPATATVFVVDSDIADSRCLDSIIEVASASLAFISIPLVGAVPVGAAAAPIPAPSAASLSFAKAICAIGSSKTRHEIIIFDSVSAPTTSTSLG